MKYIISLIAFFITIMLTSCMSESLEEKIIVTYFPGFCEFDGKVTPPVFEGIVPSDTIFITKEVYKKIKDYVNSSEAVEHSKNVDVRLGITVDTVKAYLGVFPYNYHPSEKILEMEYLIKSNSNYYNLFTVDMLNTTYCKEIGKYGIPQNYIYLDRSKQHIFKELYSYLLMVK